MNEPVKSEKKEMRAEVLRVSSADLARYRALTMMLDEHHRTGGKKKPVPAVDAHGSPIEGGERGGHDPAGLDIGSMAEERSRLGFRIANAVVGLPLDAGRGDRGGVGR